MYRKASCVIFKSHLKLEHPLNIIHLTSEEHRGENGVHGKNGATLDLKYKQALESNLRDILGKSHYTIEELIKKLLLNEEQAHKVFKKVPREPEGISREEVIFKLLGNRYYL